MWYFCHSDACQCLTSRHLNFLPAWTPHLFRISLSCGRKVGHKHMCLVFLLTTAAGPTGRCRKIMKKLANERICEWKQLQEISWDCAVTACSLESDLHRVTADCCEVAQKEGWMEDWRWTWWDRFFSHGKTSVSDLGSKCVFVKSPP